MNRLADRYRYSIIVLKEMVKTDFKLRYQGSILGIAWSVLKPLMLFVVMYTVFVRFLRFTDGTPLFPINLLLGISLWQFFSEATNMGLRAVVDRGDLLRKIHFPNYIVVVSAGVGALISLVINLLVVFVFALCKIPDFQFTWRLLLLPVNLAQYYILAIGVALLLSAVFVQFRDIGHIWEVVLQALFYGIPIFYPLSMVSEFSPTIAKIMLLNPIAQVVQDVRHNFIDPLNVPTVWSEINSVWIQFIPVCLSLAICALGIYVFRHFSRKFTEVL